jgi:Domain of Unknown Function (DUF1540)
MPNVDVKCTVANCVYHAKGNVCGADQITIDMDRVATIDTEFSEEFAIQRRKENANQSADTCCKTFKQKHL